MKINDIIDSALKIKSGEKLSLSDLNDLVADLIIEDCFEKEIKASAKRIAQDRFSYELKQIKEDENALMERLTGKTKRKSPLDL